LLAGKLHLEISVASWQFVKQYYGFETGAGQYTTDDIKNKNREIFDVLMTKMAFAYKVSIVL